MLEEPSGYVSPSSIVVGSPQQLIDITGRNYLPSTQAQVIAVSADPTTAPTVLPIQYVKFNRSQTAARAGFRIRRETLGVSLRDARSASVGHRNRTTLAVARKLVAYLLAVAAKPSSARAVGSANTKSCQEGRL
jgi:hypothetical protein